ncbi:MAG: threonine ammonia-lyase [Alphaproteobacteria bacterium]
MSSLPTTEPTIDDIHAAAKRIRTAIAPTPLLTSPALDEQVGARILIKPECLQPTGSFKIRGVTNFIAQLDPAARSAGIVAYSSGNHAQAVAASARLAGIDATIIMPADAPPIKLANTKAYGAEIVTYDRYSESREELGAALARQRGATLLPPYDHPWTIAGQGTAGLELMAQAKAIGAEPDAVLVCCGGGGLTAGMAMAIKDTRPQTEIYSIEPANFDDTARSLSAGKRLSIEPGQRSICDALLGPMPGVLTFPILRRLLAGGLTVTDDQALAAMVYAFKTLKLVVEPGGAVALAAVLSGRLDCRGKTIAVVLSGGNVEPSLLCAALADVAAT